MGGEGLPDLLTPGLEVHDIITACDRLRGAAVAGAELGQGIAEEGATIVVGMSASCHNGDDWKSASLLGESCLPESNEGDGELHLG